MKTKSNVEAVLYRRLIPAMVVRLFIPIMPRHAGNLVAVGLAIPGRRLIVILQTLRGFELPEGQRLAK